MNFRPTLQSPYSRDAWLALLRDLFGHSASLFAKPAPVTDAAFRNVFTRVLHLGDLQTADGKTAALLDIEVAPDFSLPHNRAGIRHLAARLIDGTTRQAILTAFHNGTSPDWRFSFIIRDKFLDLATGETLTHETPARRFTYLLGPNETCRTAAERFATLQGRTVSLTDIETAFKVDKLTKDFYGELSDWYFWALTCVRFPDDAEKNDETRNATMTIRLVTRLMFVWFLKQKKLIPAALFDQTEIGSLLNFKDKTESTYYKAVLQNLFFSTLNLPAHGDARRFIRRQPGCTYYRYERFFKDEAAKSRFVDLCKNIPFLNGGLFENLDRDVGTDTPIRVDGFSNRTDQENRLAIPDELFFGKEQTVDLSAFYDDAKKANVKARGLFEILNSYNFTIEENTPYDKDVALDPELLGQVFENLLASYNPETRNTARKQTGSFYTPREIVQYMVDECIVAHLKQSVGPALEDEYRKLTRYTDEPLTLTHEQKAAIVRVLFTCKIIDPACGSGAFPMGVLQQLVHILNQIDPDNACWKALVLKQAEQETGEALRSSEGSKGERLAEIGRIFDESVNRPDYARKLYLIENCVYGVDIQPIAVQISKLRFFISLVVEQNPTPDRDQNFGIRPLPNLETKFVAANTLIGIHMPKDWLNDTAITRLENSLKDIRHKHFSARTTETKLKYRALDKVKRDELKSHLVSIATRPDEEKIRLYLDRIDKLQSERTRYLEENWSDQVREPHPELFSDDKPKQQGVFRADVNKEKRDEIDRQIKDCQRGMDAEHAKVKNTAFESEARKLALWDPYDQNASSPFFDPEWMFGIKEGFDIVIGNPPYVRADHPSQVEQRKAILASGDYETLWEKWDLFVPFIERSYKLLKPGGVSALIVSDAFCHAKYAQKCQNWLMANSRILRLDFCGDLKIFDANVHNVIPLLQKADGKDNIPERRLHRETFGNVTLLPSDKQPNLTCRAFFPEETSQIQSFQAPCVKLEDICYTTYGLRPSNAPQFPKFITEELVSSVQTPLHTKKIH